MAKYQLQKHLDFGEILRGISLNLNTSLEYFNTRTKYKKINNEDCTFIHLKTICHLGIVSPVLLRSNMFFGKC